MVADSSPSVHPKLRKDILSNFYHAILYDDDEEEDFRFNDASIHLSHLRQNGISTWFGTETAKQNVISFNLK